MCGFIVYFSKNKNNLSREIKSSLNLIKNRGPDDESIVIAKKFGLGFARLAIQDVSKKGRQPMISSNKRYYLVFNGEIYNFKEIRYNLLKKGIHFKSNSDSEVLLKLFEIEGKKCLDTIDGMFSFVIVDKLKNEIFLARDRFGIKPLYYYRTNNTFFVSSEIKAFIPFSLSDSSWSFNEAFLSEYMNYRDLSGENTFIKNVKKVLPSHYITIDKNFNFKCKKYYNLSCNLKKSNNLTLNDNIDYLEELLIKNIKSHLISDVPVGLTLSGGLDSSLLTALVKKHTNTELTTYSIVFNEKISQGNIIDESGFIKIVNDLYKGKKNLINLNSKIFSEIWDKLIWHNEDPLSIPNSAGIFLLSQKASKKHKVIIGGDGADEIFAGYNTFLNQKVNILEGLYGEYKNIKGIINSKQSELIFRNNLIKKFGDYGLKSKISYLLNTKLQTLNNRLDKMSMASGVEFRVPFLTKSLLDFASGLPNEQLVKGKDTKYILKKLSERYLPKKIIYRKKIGFSLPINKWLKSREFNKHTDDINKKDSKIRELFNENYIDELSINFFNKKDTILNSNANKVWMLLNIEKFNSMFISNRKKYL